MQNNRLGRLACPADSACELNGRFRSGSGGKPPFPTCYSASHYLSSFTLIPLSTTSITFSI